MSTDLTPALPSTSRTLGIVGGGQLARMLWEAATRRCGMDAVVFTDSVGSSAEKAGARIHPGSITSVAELIDFSRKVDHVIIESEFIPVSVLQELADHEVAAKWRPAIHALMRLQTKLGQKEMLRKLGVPTAPYQLLQEPDLKELSRQLPFVLKSSHGGYDGKGILLANSESDLSERLTPFLEANHQSEIYREEKVDFVFEAALVGCRDQDSHAYFYPLVESRQWKGVCVEVLTMESQLRARLQPIAEEYATRIMKELDWQGVLAVEFFVTRDLQLLVNELAPRVHNSAHFTLNASRASQFEAHVRASCGLHLSVDDFRTQPAFVMLNLLGPEGYSGSLPPICGIRAGFPEPYDYEKGSARPRRKIGHWNYSTDEALSSDELEAILDEMRRNWAAWSRENRIRGT